MKPHLELIAMAMLCGGLSEDQICKLPDFLIGNKIIGDIGKNSNVLQLRLIQDDKGFIMDARPIGFSEDKSLQLALHIKLEANLQKILGMHLEYGVQDLNRLAKGDRQLKKRVEKYLASDEFARITHKRMYGDSGPAPDHKAESAESQGSQVEETQVSDRIVNQIQNGNSDNPINNPEDYPEKIKQNIWDCLDGLATDEGGYVSRIDLIQYCSVNNAQFNKSLEEMVSSGEVELWGLGMNVRYYRLVRENRPERLSEQLAIVAKLMGQDFDGFISEERPERLRFNQVAAELGVNERQVIMALSDLKKRGFITNAGKGSPHVLVKNVAIVHPGILPVKGKVWKFMEEPRTVQILSAIDQDSSDFVQNMLDEKIAYLEEQSQPYLDLENSLWKLRLNLEEVKADVGILDQRVVELQEELEAEKQRNQQARDCEAKLREQIEECVSRLTSDESQDSSFAAYQNLAKARKALQEFQQLVVSK